MTPEYIEYKRKREHTQHMYRVSQQGVMIKQMTPTKRPSRKRGNPRNPDMKEFLSNKRKVIRDLSRKVFLENKRNEISLTNWQTSQWEAWRHLGVERDDFLYIGR